MEFCGDSNQRINPVPARTSYAINIADDDVQADEDILTATVSDEALELAVGRGPTSFWTSPGTACCTAGKVVMPI